jgi:hypothetical protein
MKGSYNLEIGIRTTGGLNFRITNTETDKVAKFIVTKKGSESSKYFLNLLTSAVNRTK